MVSFHLMRGDSPLTAHNLPIEYESVAKILLMLNEVCEKKSLRIGKPP